MKLLSFLLGLTLLASFSALAAGKVSDRCIRITNASHNLEIDACAKIKTATQLECVRATKARYHSEISACQKIKEPIQLRCVKRNRFYYHTDILLCA